MADEKQPSFHLLPGLRKTCSPGSSPKCSKCLLGQGKLQDCFHIGNILKTIYLVPRFTLTFKTEDKHIDNVTLSSKSQFWRQELKCTECPQYARTVLILDALWLMEFLQPYKEKIMISWKKKRWRIKSYKANNISSGIFSFFENNILSVALQSSKNKASDVLYSVWNSNNKNISFYPLPPFIYLFVCYLSVIFHLPGFLLLLSPPHMPEGCAKHSGLGNMKDAVTSDSHTFKEWWVYYSSFFVMWASGRLNNVLLHSTQNVYILIPRTCEFHFMWQNGLCRCD